MAAIMRGNSSSSDNTLAFPIKPIRMQQTRQVQDESFAYPDSPRRQPQSQSNMYNIPEQQQPMPNDTDKYLVSNQQFQSASIPNFVQNNNYNNFESLSTGFMPRVPSQNEIRHNIDIYNKQAYKNALDQQVMEKEVTRFEQKKANKRSELETISQYPFGRRTDPIPYTDYSRYSQMNNYQPDFGSRTPFFRDESNVPRYDKNNIIEKPNSLSADTPPYDPIKHRNGFQQGYNYNPWGKPGGGAPLIDPNTGRKYTKITGQLGMDQIGLSADERARMMRTKPATLEEQKYDMSIEKERKRQENETYKARAGDVATWITGLENARLVHLSSNNGAHLHITNVTRDKINLESVRRQNEKSQVYHDELGKQLEEKNRQNKLYKLKDDVAGIEHTRKWDDWWGKPGGGAPNTDPRRRDLTGSLESPREFTGLATSLPIGSPRLKNDPNTLFPKSSTKSNHSNLYDNITAMKL